MAKAMGSLGGSSRRRGQVGVSFRVGLGLHLGLSSDDEPWQDRPAGDRLIREGDLISVMVDLRGINGNPGALLYAVNDGPYEVAFSNLPMDPGVRMMPVVSMGGGGTVVRVRGASSGTQQPACVQPPML
ncbi:Ubiquitin recognition factor in ER-associated degradation protein 1 [Perkinsus olseni]|uniref:Ubiquitin recognition factor in ER-associated degradation protein 1 n=1 Tax=Perkinsus olseni TaxID=32597 RepID=A0A7J6UKP1_PEROL|nr:Ubiquitin recognition factor in ER-associated degradation protein 1 [Perkinsus olseni]